MSLIKEKIVELWEAEEAYDRMTMIRPDGLFHYTARKLTTKQELDQYFKSLEDLKRIKKELRKMLGWWRYIICMNNSLKFIKKL